MILYYLGKFYRETVYLLYYIGFNADIKLNEIKWAQNSAENQTDVLLKIRFNSTKIQCGHGMIYLYSCKTIYTTLAVFELLSSRM